MSGEIVIRASGLGKKYLIGHEAERERYTMFRDVIARNARNMVRSVKDLAHGRSLVVGDTIEEFWALKGVDFEVRRGEVVGIIGRNGAGKSTLLKILSRITEPTEGRVEIKGRVASLLEVGTGFHAELTGRENVFLNGAILGMSRAEIRRKFDEIVAFAEVERFLDTPVKRYSSGMYMRLAFAVAAHLEPEILIVDEVLSVGDAEFQKKCLGKMQDVAGHGRTVLFVSHNLGAVSALCSSCIGLRNGRVFGRGDCSDIIAEYVAADASTSLDELDRITDRKGNGRVIFKGVSFCDGEGNSIDLPVTGRDTLIVLHTTKLTKPASYRASLLFSTITNVPLLLCSTELVTRGKYQPPSDHALVCSIPRLPLDGGRYVLNLFLEDGGEICDWLDGQLNVDVANGDFHGTGRNLPRQWNTPLTLVEHSWLPESDWLTPIIKRTARARQAAQPTPS